MPEAAQAIRAAVHAGWAPDNGCFRDEIESLAKRRVAPLVRGRKSAGCKVG